MVCRGSCLFILSSPSCVLLRGFGEYSGGLTKTRDPDYSQRVGGALHLHSDGGYIQRDNDACNGMAALENVAARRLAGGSSGHGALAYCGGGTGASDIIRAAGGTGILSHLVDGGHQEFRQRVPSDSGSATRGVQGNAETQRPRRSSRGRNVLPKIEGTYGAVVPPKAPHPAGIWTTPDSRSFTSVWPQ